MRYRTLPPPAEERSLPGSGGRVPDAARVRPPDRLTLRPDGSLEGTLGGKFVRFEPRVDDAGVKSWVPVR